MEFVVRVLLLLWLVVASLGGARADDEWHVQVTPYLWATALDGRLTPSRPGPSFNSHLSSSDILERLDAAFFLTGTVRYKRFVLLGDFAYGALSDSSEVARYGSYRADAYGKLDQIVATLAGGYTVATKGRFAVDALAGVRLFSLYSAVRSELKKSGRPLLVRSASGRLTWPDPIVGARARIDLFPRLSAIGYADVGGWNNRLSWQAVGTLNYRATDNLFFSAGYRHMSIDVSDGNSEVDVDLSGPIIGATLRF